MRLHFICNYCDSRWTKTVYNKITIMGERCSKCNDKQLKIIDLDKDKIDYYQGSPAFKKEDELLDYDSYL